MSSEPSPPVMHEPGPDAGANALYVEAKRVLCALPSEPSVFPAEIQVCDEAMVHHLRVVCRAKPGYRLVVVDKVREIAYQAVIGDLGKDVVLLHLENRLETPPSAIPTVILAAALIKEQRWDVLLQKATELGVRAIQPLLAERSVVRLSEKDFERKQARWLSVLQSAAEQSEGLFVPKIYPPQSVSALIALTQAGDTSLSRWCLPPSGSLDQTASILKIVLRERGTERQPLKQVLSQYRRSSHAPSTSSNQAILLTIGPEGGWSLSEIQAFRQGGFLEASLGARVLRSETAAMAVAAAVAYEFEG